MLFQVYSKLEQNNLKNKNKKIGTIETMYNQACTKINLKYYGLTLIMSKKSYYKKNYRFVY